MPGQIQTTQPSSYGPIFGVTKEKSNAVLAAAASAGRTVTRVYGYNSSKQSDHRFMQCIDFMHYRDTRMRDWLVDYLVDHYRQLGIMGLISNGRCMGFPSQETRAADREVSWSGSDGHGNKGDQDGGWRKYNGADQHTDHVHVQFNTSPISGSTKPSGGGKVETSTGGWAGTLHVVRGPVMAFDGSGNDRPELALKKGEKVTGEVDDDPFGDGRYFRVGKVPHRLWYPLEGGNFAHDPDGEPIGAEPKVSLAAVIRASKLDPDRKQGGVTPGAEDDVRVVEAALVAEGLLARKYAADGSFGSSAVEAYAGWQRRNGYSGKDANGIPGGASLKKLGSKHDFKVVK